MTELGEEILGIPVRRGVPKGVGGLAEVVRNAAFSTAVGLVQYGVARQAGDRPSGDAPKRSRRPLLPPAPLALERVLAPAPRRSGTRRRQTRRRTFETSSAAAIGLVRWSLQPAARQAARWSGVALAVSATIGRQNPAARSRVVAPSPSSTGMRMSIRISAKSCASAFSIACSPSVARPTMAPAVSSSLHSASASAPRRRRPGCADPRAGARAPAGSAVVSVERDLDDARCRIERKREPEGRSFSFAAGDAADSCPSASPRRASRARARPPIPPASAPTPG